LQAAIDESSCGGDRGGVGGIDGGSEEEQYVEGRRGKSLSRSRRSLNWCRRRSPRRRRSSNLKSTSYKFKVSFIGTYKSRHARAGEAGERSLNLTVTVMFSAMLVLATAFALRPDPTEAPPRLGPPVARLRSSAARANRARRGPSRVGAQQKNSMAIWYVYTESGAQ
jgi:hypothetical protein